MSQTQIPKRTLSEVLPPLFTAIDSLDLKNSSSYSSSFAGLTVVASESKEVKLLDSGVLGDLAKKITENLATFGWKPNGSPVIAQAEGKNFLVVPKTSIKSSNCQVGRDIGMRAATFLKRTKVDSLCVLPGEMNGCDILDGLFLGLQDSGVLKSKKEPVAIKDITLVQNGITEEDLSKRKALAKSISLARTLQDAPPNWLNSERFAAVAEEIFAKNSRVKLKIYGRKELEDMGAGSFLSVALGSPVEPKMICIEIEGKAKGKPIAYVGKGLTFDTGGNSLKPALGMGDMKYDMSGGAAVFGTAFYFSEIEPSQNVVCAIGAVENIPGGAASRPSDIVQAMNGKTIDIQNTDAEGRLVLADVLCHVETTYDPAMIVDAATLTGAVVYGLGHCGAALMGDDDAVNKVKKAGELAGEPLWQMPFWPELSKELKGSFSDLKNITKPNVLAGTITAGLFLREFVEKTPWVHMDIAGTAYSCGAVGYVKSNGSGFGVRTMVQLVDL